MFCSRTQRTQLCNFWAVIRTGSWVERTKSAGHQCRTTNWLSNKYQQQQQQPRIAEFPPRRQAAATPTPQWCHHNHTKSQSAKTIRVGKLLLKSLIHRLARWWTNQTRSSTHSKVASLKKTIIWSWMLTLLVRANHGFICCLVTVLLSMKNAVRSMIKGIRTPNVLSSNFKIKWLMSQTCVRRTFSCLKFSTSTLTISLCWSTRNQVG